MNETENKLNNMRSQTKDSRRTFAFVGKSFVASIVTLLLSSVPLFAATQSTTYDVAADFNQGDLFNTDVVTDDLQLTQDFRALPVLWIANAGEDTVSKFDPVTGNELARYRTFVLGGGDVGPLLGAHGSHEGPAPSRTSVDAKGNVYVLNRHFETTLGFDGGPKPASLMKILASGGIDRNNNGIIDTASDLNNNGSIDPAELFNIGNPATPDLLGNPGLVDFSPVDGFVDEAGILDERIAWIRLIGPVSGLGRSLSIAPNGNVWVGLFNAKAYYEIDPDGNTVQGPLSTGSHTPYGSLVQNVGDQNGDLIPDGIIWSASLNTSIARIESWTGNVQIFTAPGGFASNYGIALGDDSLFLGSNLVGGQPYKFHIPSLTFQTIPFNPAAVFGKGISIDGLGDVFISGSSSPEKGATKIDVNGNIIWTSPQFGGAVNTNQRGAIVDSNNDVWIIALNDNKLLKYDGSTGAPVLARNTGAKPYTYSDASGLALIRENPSGFWTVIFDSGAPNTRVESVSWADSLPANTTLDVEVRGHNIDVSNANYESVAASGGAPASTVIGQYIELRVSLADLFSAGISPVLDNITLEYNLAPLVTTQDLTFIADTNLLSPVIAPADVFAGGNDPEDGVGLTLSLDQTGPFTVGVHTVTLTGTDQEGHSTSATATITVVDTPPTINLVGAASISHPAGTSYTDQGVTATDIQDGALGVDPHLVLVTNDGGFDPNTTGVYTWTYTVTDRGGNSADVTREVTVVNTPPTIVLIGADPLTLPQGIPFVDPGADAEDAEEGDLDGQIVVTGTVDVNTLGSYTVTYTVTDATGASASVDRTVVVDEPPAITLNGSTPITIAEGSSYTDAGATGIDLEDGALIPVVAGSVDTITPGSYTLTYTVTDSASQSASTTRTVVVDALPTVTLIGATPITVAQGSVYSDAGATGNDAEDGPLAPVVAGSVDTNTPGSYTLTYTVTDSFGSSASTTREVTVDALPVVILVGSPAVVVPQGFPYNELGAAGSDLEDGSLSPVITGVVDTNLQGTYLVTYAVTDSFGSTAYVTRSVYVDEVPSIALSGSSTVVAPQNGNYNDPGANGSDLEDGSLTPVVTGTVDFNTPGTYVLTYTVTDSVGNSASVTRTIVVDGPPTITLAGGNPISIVVGGTYTELGATADDLEDGDITGDILIIGSVNTSVVGVYLVNYSVTDSAGNTVTVVRTVNVEELSLPFANYTVVFGCIDATVHKDAKVFGSVGSFQKVFVDQKAEVSDDVIAIDGIVDIKNNGKVGDDILAGSSVKIHKGAVVSGDATSEADVKVYNGGSVLGTVTENAAPPVIEDMPLPILDLQAGSSNQTANKNKTKNVAPGLYGNLRAKQGGTINLSAGRYGFKSIKLDKDSTLNLDVSGGAIIVDVKAALNAAAKNTKIVVTGGPASQALFQIQGTQVHFGNDSDAAGTYLAPNAHIQVGNNSNVDGALYGNKVSIKNGAVVNGDAATSLLSVVATEWIGWKDCKHEETSKSKSSSKSTSEKSDSKAKSKSKSTSEKSDSKAKSDSKSKSEKSDSKAKSKSKSKSEKSNSKKKSKN